MQVDASIDESDVGPILPGLRVGFTVDAYPDQRFTGTVAQVRLDPTVASNVVTYATIIDAPNPSLALKPGMTANVTVHVGASDGVNAEVLDGVGEGAAVVTRVALPGSATATTTQKTGNPFLPSGPPRR